MIRKRELISKADNELLELKKTVKKLLVDAFGEVIDTVK